MDGIERASKGQPSAVKGLIQMMKGPGGFMILMDPMKFMTTAVSMRDQAYQDGDGNAFDSFLSQSGLFFNPALQAAATMLGFSKNNNPDPFTTFQGRRLFGAIANTVQAERGGPMLGAPFQQAMNNWAESMSGIFSKLGLPGQEQRFATDPKANDRTLIRNEILDLVQSDLGITSGDEFDQWTDAQIATLEAAYDALDSGITNPYTDQAYKNWARTNAMRMGVSMTLPVGTAMRSSTRDNRLNKARRIPGVDGGESVVPPGGKGFQQERDITAAASGTPTDIAVSDAQFDSLFPANAAGRVTESANGLTQDEFRSKSTNAAYDQYRGWKSDIGGPDNYAAFREEMTNASPAYRAYIEDLQSQPFYQQNQSALDNAGVSFAAYLVLNGSKIQQFDPNRGDTMDASMMNPSTFGSGGDSYSSKTKDLKSTIAGQLVSYQQDQRAFQAAATKYFGQEIQLDAISPMAQRYIRNELSKFGIRIPQLGDQASAYQAWSRIQPQGSDISLDAYIRSTGGQPPLTPMPTQTTIAAP
jgi:hypothetical protein